MMEEWYRHSVEACAGRLEVDLARGLTTETARARLAETGPNDLPNRGGRSPWRILAEQFQGAMVLLLAAAGATSAFLHEYQDAIAIGAILLLNALLGFVQDFRAERALAALRKLSVPQVRVRRDGHVLWIGSSELVPGDVVLLEAGSLVPADLRLVEAVNLKIQEAALTGESQSVEKSIDPLPVTPQIADRSNMAFMGTSVTYGRGVGLVVATGMRTQLGGIARMLQTVEREATPLQRKLSDLGKALALGALALVALVFVLGLFAGEPVKLMLLTGLSLAVAVVPEGLPAVATVALAVGARRMVQRNALIRKLPAVETLGSVTVICSDKTGTLTQNRMTLEKVAFAGAGVFDVANLKGAPAGYPESCFGKFLEAAALCNDVDVEPDRGEEGFLGEPTEVALVQGALRLGVEKISCASRLPRVGEIPFDSVKKRMITVHEVSGPDGRDHKYLAYCKGAFDSVLGICDHVATPDGIEPLAGRQEALGRLHDELADRGLRVMAISFRGFATAAEVPVAQSESGHVLLGLVAIGDPPRPEVKDAVARCRQAGIRPVMITGDHPRTAAYIARELGVSGEGRGVMTGTAVSGLGEKALEQAVDGTAVFARVSPADKLHIVKAFQRGGHVVAMTGDGVNDAPALKQADIGVAMGITGTDVSKEAAQMVLLDDNFTSIVSAVEEGRVIYDNIRKFVKYTLTSNVGELVVMLLAPLLGLPLPLLPLQILWVNLVTDGLPGLALSLERAEPGTMARPPFAATEGVLGRGMGRDILWIGGLMGLVCLGAAYLYYPLATEAPDYWRTIIFTVLTLSQMGNVLALRSERQSFFRLGVASNPALLGAVALTLALQMGVIYLPSWQEVFQTAPLAYGDLGVCLGLSAIVFTAVEMRKGFAAIMRKLK